MMRALLCQLAVALAVPCSACAGPERPAGTWSGAEVALEPAANLAHAPRVVRIRVAGTDIDPRAFVLFEGALGDYHAARVRDGEIPATLGERRVPAVAWGDPASAEVVVAPARRLDAGATYAVAALGFGDIATLHVVEDGAPFAARIWPPAASAAGGRLVYCGNGVSPAPTEIVFGPSGLTVDVAPGADSLGSTPSTCFHADLPGGAGGTLVVPPPLVSGVALNPSPVVVRGEPAELLSSACLSPEVAFGPGCAAPSDDSVVIRSPGVALLWTASWEGGELAEPVPPGGRIVLGGLSPDGLVSFRGAATDVGGHERPFDEAVRTSAPTTHLVLNEVLANPAGPEPRQEWIELVNRGTGAASLAGYWLEDGGGQTELPAAVIPPGAFALVVSEDFDAATGNDVSPAPGTLLVRVRRLGSSGLSNGGEALTLHGSDGGAVSRFPAVPAGHAGVSVARATPDALDDDRTAFGPSDEGASPGAPNHLGSR